MGICFYILPVIILFKWKVDDLIHDHKYSVAANHDENHGVEIRKKIWKVTGNLH